MTLRRAPGFRQTHESFFRVPLRKEHRRQSEIEQTANRGWSAGPSTAGAVGGTLLYYAAGQPAVKESVRPEKRMLGLTSLYLTVVLGLTIIFFTSPPTSFFITKRKGSVV